MAMMTMVEATALAITQEMRRDASVWVLGEDVQAGGIFGQYKGLFAEFGRKRVVNTPIAESTIMNAGLGAALVGTRPVIEMRIADFGMCAMDEIVNQIAKIRYMFGGQARARLVVRMPHGLLKSYAAQHSQVFENWFVNLPGVVVVTPATPADAAGLLKTAIRSDDPVLFFDPKALFALAGEMPDVIVPIPFGVANHLHAGTDLTLVTWSQAVPAAQVATREAATRGIRVDLFDLRTLWPWDEEAIARSLAMTRRLLVVHEGVAVGGFGGEVITRMLERLGPQALLAVERLGSPRIPAPFAPNLENSLRVGEEKIGAAILRVCAAGPKDQSLST